MNDNNLPNVVWSLKLPKVILSRCRHVIPEARSLSVLAQQPQPDFSFKDPTRVVGTTFMPDKAAHRQRGWKSYALLQGNTSGEE